MCQEAEKAVRIEGLPMKIEHRALNILTKLRRVGLRSASVCAASSYWIAIHPIEEEWTVGDLADLGETSRATISRCLGQMLELGLAEESDRKGRSIFYRFTRAAYRMGYPRKYKDFGQP